jgi:hypothetical protein
MHPGSIATFYRARRALVVLAWLAPVLLLAGAWVLVDEVLLAPRIPDEQTPANELLAYIVNSRGLPRLSAERRCTLLEQQARRLLADAALRAQFLAAYRTAGRDEQEAFRVHVFDAFKPLVMRDVRGYSALAADDSRRSFLDQRIVAYGRLAAMWGSARISRRVLGSGAPDTGELLQLVMDRTSADERDAAAAYLKAYAARVGEVLADPELKRALEEQVAAAGR